MALTGIQIFKFLPAAKKTEKANCKQCGCPTCMAYAMKLAKGDVDIDACPFIDEDLKKTLSFENRKPQTRIEIGNENKVVFGDENVLFRHDKTFVNPCPFGLKIFSSDKNFQEKLEQILDFKVERVGKEFKIDAIVLIEDSYDFVKKANILLDKDRALVFVVKELNSIRSIIEKIKEKKVLVYLENQKIEEISELEKIVPVVVDGNSPEDLSQKTNLLLKNTAKNIVLNLKNEVSSDIIEPLTMIRRSAIENKFEPLGFPVISFYDLSGNIAIDTIKLSTLVCKYSNFIVMDQFNPALLNALITLRMNIYTDPQKPLQVEPKLYEIGDVTPSSKVMVTTNFALTYFAVVNEIESLSEGYYLLITDSDGMSVLTAWSASKFTGEIIAKAVKNSNIIEKINHKKIIIPGLVSDLLEEIKEELPEFDIVAGPNEATELPEFLKNYN